jgi:hypothetical protein
MSVLRPLLLRKRRNSGHANTSRSGQQRIQLRFAGGRFVQYGGDDKFAGSALLEMYDGDDRLVLDHGASGAAVLDCDGRVVAVVTILLTKTMSFLSSVIRISTAWNSPNVVATPIQVVKDIFSSD